MYNTHQEETKHSWHGQLRSYWGRRGEAVAENDSDAQHSASETRGAAEEMMSPACRGWQHHPKARPSEWKRGW